MDAINERFIKLRKACKKNQTDFANILGISRSGVGDIETGRRNVTEKHLLMLKHWDEYNVNIEWLRTGVGEMFLPTETDTLERIRQEYHLTDPQFRLVSNFLRLPENEKDIVFNFRASVFDSGSTNGSETETVDQKIERELAAYRADLELEARQAVKSSASNAHDANTAKEA